MSDAVPPQTTSPVSQFEQAADAIVSGDIATLRQLIAANPELVRMRSTRDHRSTLLHYVSANGIEDFRQHTPQNIVEITSLLLDSGADVNAESNAYGGRSTALGLAATSCHPQDAGVQIPLLALLIERGARIDGPDSGSGSAVIACLRNGRGEAAAYLATCGARLDLEGAAGIGRLDIVQSFFNGDGTLQPPATEQQMINGFAWACEFGHNAVIEFLLRNGMRADAKLRGGETGLHWAALEAQVDTVKLLLNRGAPVDLIDTTYHATPLGWALYGWLTSKRRKPHPDVVALLMRAGAMPDPQFLDANSDRLRSDPRMLAALRGE